MNKLLKILLGLLLFSTFCLANSLRYSNLYDQSFSLNKGSFKVLEFDKIIKNVKVSDETSLEVDFLENINTPLQAIKIYSKKLGHGNVLVTFEDATSLHIDINIIENLGDIISIAKQISGELIVKQTNGKIILDGFIKNQKIKDKILDLFKKAGADLEKDLVDLTALRNPDKMIRVKLYAAEINNTKGIDLKNNWFVSSKNYVEVVDKDNRYYNLPLGANGLSSVDNQRSKVVHDTINEVMRSAVTLTGGLTGAANYLGKYFNVGLTLNYLSSRGVANILDETTLITLEDKESKFLAGGTIYLKIQTTTDKGVPSTEIRNINYGLQLEIKARNIVDEKFVNLEINTKSTQIDWANQVDGIPSFTEKSINTNVIVGNSSTIVLGGLINSSSTKDIDKIPLLGDLPILGALFRSKSFKEGQSELVFFITPEIVDPRTNSQKDILDEKSKFLTGLKMEEIKEDKKEEKIVEAKEEIETKKLNTYELQQKRLNDFTSN